MGTLGLPETVFIFLLALLLFGPKKLPELGRTLGKAMTEFRRASNELKATFDREMKSLEQETESLKEVTSHYQNDTYNYDDPSYESGYEDPYATETYDSSVATSPSTSSASAPQGAESPTAVTPEGTIARGGETAAVVHSNGDTGNSSPVHHPAASEPASASTTAENKA
ncbi:MAG TPA: TatA/E family twin arginine-targeting protein translocase [Bryobacteraceae bacterium]|nr:TatA/E family twin arginine-targeting protein translocase [Bryobacteraceae bacterium]